LVLCAVRQGHSIVIEGSVCGAAGSLDRDRGFGVPCGKVTRS
jgi:hypothetical protein